MGMPNIRLIKNEPGDRPPLMGEVDREKVLYLPPDTTLTAVLMIGGMNSGKSSAMFHLKLPDGTELIFEQSMHNLNAMVRAFNIWDGKA